MLQKLKDTLKGWSENGIKAPLLLENEGKRSVTLTFVYLTGILMLLSLTILHFQLKLLTATLTTVGVWTIATVLYMFRSLHKAKIDLQNKTVDLESDEKEDNKNDTNK